MPKNPRWNPDTVLSPEDCARWKKLLTAQNGIISVEQVREYGLTRNSLIANVRAGRWRQVLPRIYCVFTGPLPRDARMAAALLYGGPWSMLSHRTAAEEWGLVPVSADSAVHITTPYGHSAVSQPPLVHVHRSRAFNHIVTATEPPRTSREDTIIDLSASEPTAREALETFLHLGGSSNVALWRLHQQLELRPPFRHRKAMVRALELLGSGAVSVLEAEYMTAVEQAHGLPAGIRQVPFVVDDRTLWEDVTYDNAGVPLTVRLDGRGSHSAPRIAFRDRRRDNAAELSDRPRLVYGWQEVHNDPCGVAGEVLQVLRREGWTGTSRSCPRCKGS